MKFSDSSGFFETLKKKKNRLVLLGCRWEIIKWSRAKRRHTRRHPFSALMSKSQLMRIHGETIDFPARGPRRNVCVSVVSVASLLVVAPTYGIYITTWKCVQVLNSFFGARLSVCLSVCLFVCHPEKSFQCCEIRSVIIGRAVCWDGCERK